VGKGSEFVLSLPVVLQEPEFAEVVKKNAPGIVVNTPTLDTRKILVVDDNIDAADMLGAVLGMEGFSVTAVYDGLTAVATAGEIRPDVVVMDIGMPGLNGYDAAQLIRKQPGNDNIVLIALTGWGQSSDLKRAHVAGFDNHFVKPVDYAALMKCLQGG
jgi:CheY-like chemotaxis protein